MKNILTILFLASLALPAYSFAAINTVYDAKLKANEIKDAVVNSPLYGIAIYSGSTIVFFVIAILVIFILIMLLKR